MKSLFCYLLVCFPLALLAKDPLPQSPDDLTLQRMLEHNRLQSLLEAKIAHSPESRNNEISPFVEYGQTGYIFFNDDNYSGYATEIKNKIAETLPVDTKLVVYTTSSNSSYLQRIKERFSQFIDEDRLIVISVPSSSVTDFWSRDGLPIPVWNKGQFALVDARYYYNFEPDAFLAQLFDVLKTKHDYFFEGGNLMANSLGDCIVVNRRRSYPGGTSDTAAIPDSVFQRHYGCNRLLRLRHLKGIGHADEVVKFMGDNIVVTDTPEYVEQLEEYGYKVHLLPEPSLQYETYVNSLQVNDTLYVPLFGEPQDKQALSVYESLDLGLKIIAIDTKFLATRGQGGIHCITQNYPPAPISQILRQIQGEFFTP